MFVKYPHVTKACCIIKTSTYRTGFMVRNWRMASDNNNDTPIKSYKSAVVIIPPENIWEQIQAIRKVHDKAYNRWMPHINLVYPFVPDEDDGNAFLEAANKIEKALSDLVPFTICFTTDSFQYFRHCKNCTLWLKPLPSVRNSTSQMKTDYEASDRICKDEPLAADTSNAAAAEYTVTDTLMAAAGKAETRGDDSGVRHPGVMKLQQLIENQFPGFQDLSNISERGFMPHLSLGQFSPKQLNTYRRQFSEKWSKIEFEVNSVHLISRKDFTDPFHIRQSVRIGQK